LQLADVRRFDLRLAVGDDVEAREVRQQRLVLRLQRRAARRRLLVQLLQFLDFHLGVAELFAQLR
jgi:hypothetical protein